MLAALHNWTPEQVDRLDPHFIDELLARHNAVTTKSKKDIEAIKRKN